MVIDTARSPPFFCDHRLIEIGHLTFNQGNTGLSPVGRAKLSPISSVVVAFPLHGKCREFKSLIGYHLLL